MALASPRLHLFRRFLSLSVQLRGLVRVAVLFGCLPTVLGFFGGWSYLFDLCAHFRVQYFIGLSVIALLLLFLRQWLPAAVCAGFALVNLAVLVPFYVPARVQAAASESFRLLHANVHTENLDASRIAALIRETTPDFLLLEEVNQRWLDDLSPVLGPYPHFRLEAREDNFGIGFYSKLAFAHAEIAYLGDKSVPSVVADFETGRERFRIVGTHPIPPMGRDMTRRRNLQIEGIVPKLGEVETPVLVVGDLNTTPWGYPFRKLLREGRLRDSTRGRGIWPTWPTYFLILGIPIDHCLHTPDIIITRRETGPDIGSDHVPLLVDFALVE